MLLTFFCTCSPLLLGVLFCSSARVCLVLGILFSPAVGPLFFTRCGSALLYPLWVRSSYPPWVRSSVIHHGVLDLWRLRLPVDSLLSSTELLASCLLHHPVWSCSLHVLRVVWWSPSTTHSLLRALRVLRPLSSRDLATRHCFLELCSCGHRGTP